MSQTEMELLEAASSELLQRVDKRRQVLIAAWKIASTVLSRDIWFAKKRSFESPDGCPVFYADELAVLCEKDAAQLRAVADTKSVFENCRVVR